MDTPHWQTDGEWKEGVLRHTLRRNLPSTVSVGRGFVISREHESRQIDVLIHDGRSPVLFRDGDLVFITPDAVLGIVEVKSRLTPQIFREAAARLAQDIGWIRSHPNLEAFTAILGFECTGGQPADYLKAAYDAAADWNQRLDFAAVGPDNFIRYWQFDPINPQFVRESWHFYDLMGQAVGYLLHNIVDAVSPQSVGSNVSLWFPAGGKEPHLTDTRNARWAAKDSIPR